MSRIERAIEFFQGCLHDCGNPEFIGLAIEALREKQERSKGCVWCKEDSKVFHDGRHFNRFCSYCGKRLEK